MGKKHLFLPWVLCFTTIPLLSFFGRSWQRAIFSLLSPLQLTVLLVGASVLVFLYMVWLSTFNATKKDIFTVFLVATGFVAINLLLPPVERIHVIVFSLFGFFSARLFGVKTAITLCLAVSGADELFQYFLPERVGDWRDVATNSLSSTLGITLFSLLIKDSSKQPFVGEYRV